MSSKDEVLAELQEVGHATAKQISEFIGMPTSNVYRALRRLEIEGLITSDNYQRNDKLWFPEEG